MATKASDEVFKEPFSRISRAFIKATSAIAGVDQWVTARLRETAFRRITAAIPQHHAKEGEGARERGCRAYREESPLSANCRWKI